MEDNIVEVGACRCPGTPHLVDTVTLAPKVTIPLGIACIAAIRDHEGALSDLEGALGGIYLRLGVIGWTFVDAEGKAVPVNARTLETYLPYGDGGYLVAERADTLYSSEVLRPLVERQRSSSERGPMAVSTSATPLAGPSAPKPSKRSSPTHEDGKPSEALAR